jgi:DNA mismatch repair protein MutL
MTPVGGPNKIQVLPSDVIGRIAAGEVVERPAAVVKELIENSLDAGSTIITVEIQEAGLGFIRVTDNGHGMTRDDALLAFERHATSKLRSDADLDRVRTLGFRGEALPSIAAVSRVSVTTAVAGQQLGTRLSIAGGRMEGIDDVACVAGTRIEVASLFFNTPARKKFLKSVGTEFSHISLAVQQASLAWPQVHFRLLHNNHEVLNCPGVCRHRDRVYQIYRDAFMDRTLEIEAEQQGLGLKGYIVDPVQARATKAPQDLFVNRRPVRNPTVLHALSDGYSAFLAKGRHPVFVLFMDLDTRHVDVNVHPMKREVRFVDAETVHRAVRSAVRERLGVRTTSRQTSSVETASESEDRRGAGPAQATAAADGIEPTAADLIGAQCSLLGEASCSYEASVEPVVAFGQMARTFLIAQIGDELHVVDQHTAHERVLFERLQRQWHGRLLVSQPLVLPQPIDVSAQQAELMRRHAEGLEQFGLSIEPFGAGTFLVRAVPAMLAHADIEALVHDLIEDLEELESLSSLEQRVKPILASLACHGAVRAGRPMALPEIRQLVVEWVQEGRIMTCPHGRRVAFRLSGDELARLFSRM